MAQDPMVTRNAPQFNSDYLDDRIQGQTGNVQTLTPQNLSQSPGAVRIINGLRQLFGARTMEDHCQVMGLFSKDLIWDAPGFMVQRKGQMRTALYLGKFLGVADLRPLVVQVIAQLVSSQMLPSMRTHLLRPGTYS